MSASKKALLFGVDSFTGRYLKQAFEKNGVSVVGTTLSKNLSTDCDITDYHQCVQFIKATNPDYVVNLSGISFVPFSDYKKIYEVNFSGAINILRACEDHAPNCCLLLISSGQLYAQHPNAINESGSLEISNHYSVSKNAMEMAAKLSSLNVRIARSFNYTGVGQSNQFLIPKIISHFKEKRESIILGDTNVFRDFSDVRDVVNAYVSILVSNTNDQLFNVCSNSVYSISDIINFLNQECGYTISVKESKEFKRSNVIPCVKGNNSRLSSLGWNPSHTLFDTLKWMLYD